MPKPCPRCGLENADEAARCSRCDAPLRGGEAISPEFRRFLLWLAAFAVITAIGASALVYVHRTAVPLGDPVGPAIDPAAQEERFAREQALEAPPPTPGAIDPAPPGTAPAGTNPPVAPVAPQAQGPAPDAAAGPDAGPSPGEPRPDALDPLLDEEDVTGEMPPVSPGVDWSREILPPTGRPTPSPGTPFPVAPQADEPLAFPESDPAGSFPPVAPPGLDTGRVDTGQEGRSAAAPDGSAVQPGAPADSAGGEPPRADGAEQAQAPGTDRSLEEVQRAQCANEGFLTRFVCHERVRLAYCDNRWNRHPDCMVDSNATNY